jgi:hypothetical protein
VNEKYKGHIRVGARALLWKCGTRGIITFFNKLNASYFLHAIPMAMHWNPYVVLSPTGGAKEEYWVQPFGNGSSGFVQPFWVVGR